MKFVIFGIKTCIFLLIPIYSINAQMVNRFEDPVYANKFTVEDGLSQSNVNAVLKDHDGFLWIATDDGLNRFDGYDFRTFKHNDGDSLSLGNNQVKALFQDSQHRLWIGTVAGGLNLYDKNTETFSKFITVPDPTAFGSNSVLCIAEDTSQNLWVGTYHGLLHVEAKSRKFIKIFLNDASSQNANGVIYSLYRDKKNRIWVGTEYGFYIVEARTGNFTKHLTDQDDVPFNRVSNFYMDEQQRMWICTNGQGLFMYDERTYSYTRFLHDPKNPLTSLGNNLVRDIAEVNGLLLVGTDGAGVSVIDPKTLKVQRMRSKNDPTLLNAQVYEVYDDNENSIWIGTYGGGLRQINQNRKNFIHYEFFDSEMTRIGKNSVLALAEDRQKNIWIGTDGGGLYKFEPATRKFTGFQHYPGNTGTISGNVIKSLLVDDQNNLYAGTFAKGLNIINLKTGKVTLFVNDPEDDESLLHNSVWSLLQDREKRIWVGTLGGLNEYSPAEQIFVRHEKNQSFPAITAFSIFEDRFNDLWFGTRDNGLFYFNKKSDSIQRFLRTENGLNSSEIRDIFEDKTGKLWVTAIGGLNSFDYKKDQFLSLPSIKQKDLVSTLEDKEGNFWIGSYHGLIKFQPETGDTKIYDVTDGLQGNEFNYGAKLKSSKGDFYFGGLNGLTVFRPEDIRDNTTLSPVVLLDFYLFHKKINVGESGTLQQHINYHENIILEPDQNSITIEYAAIEFNFPRRNVYAYKLEGFDKHWNFVGDQRKATYTNLPAGEFTFKVKSTNNDGVWNKDYKTVKITILRPWHKLTWVRIILGMGVFLFIIGVFRVRTSLLRKQKNNLEKLVEKRTNQIALQKTEIENKSMLLEQAHEEIKSTNEELLRINSNLERLVDQRTLELRNTLKKLMETDQDLNTFLYRSSHDLRGPITTLMGLSQLAKTENHQGELNRYFDKINFSCVHMLKLLKKLNETHFIFRTNSSSERIDWGKVFDDVQQELLKLDPLGEVKVLIHNVINGDVYSDEHLLGIIILNLMENGVIFRRDENATLHLKLSLLDNQLIITVRDNGIGMPENIRDEIFGMFYRGSERSIGNGLGLFLVKKSTELLKGTIEVTSKVGEYTLVKVILPLQAQR
jgi:ligand-binding sensor domain-containing protein/signal transduction histidine kinase